MITKNKFALSIHSIQILREGIKEFKLFADGINYIDSIFKEEKV